MRNLLLLILLSLNLSSSSQEPAYFGVNYTVPFAHGYRAHRALGVDHEAAIRADVYAMQRLGLNAFRVHVWDTEITDSLGNLKENEHLRLYDFLLAELKRRGIRTVLTPLAFWGPGYPEPDSATGSFSAKWSKRQVLVTEAAVQAQERYLGQLLKHRNPYTGTTYEGDKDIIALEINNEPHHSGPLGGAADYISRMVKAVRGSGWTKPVYYNISESPAYAAAVAAADIQGVSFQWYPTGLVANRTLQGNYLPHVDRYRIPFDSIAAFRNKARMVYEFDAGDVIQPYMYPAMARSFRAAGFQWATQFAYDPLHTADVNTEYQTHYVNMLYTPAKAVSLLIAGEAFRRLPRGKEWGTGDTVFGGVRLSYERQLSEFVHDTAFYYSNHTDTRPRDAGRLRHLAGVGSSPLVRYSGSGAYFLDRIAPGAWRLEVLPDAVELADAFGPARPSRPVRRLEYREREMEIFLPDLGPAFFVQGLNGGNNFSGSHGAGGMKLRPGVYGLNRPGVRLPSGINREFYIPARGDSSLQLMHRPPVQVIAGRPFTLEAEVAGAGDSLGITVELRHSAGGWKSLPARPAGPHRWTAEVPADFAGAGLLQYRFVVRQGGSVAAFPGGYNGDPYAWNAPAAEYYELPVIPAAAPLRLFDPARDRAAVVPWIQSWNEQSVGYPVSQYTGRPALRLEEKGAGVRGAGFQLYVGDRIPAGASYTHLALEYAVKGTPEKITVSLIDRDGRAYTAPLPPAAPGNLLGYGTVNIPLNSLVEGPMLLLPRPYPGFGHLEFDAAGTRPFDLSRIERLEVRVSGAAYSIEIGAVALRRP